MKRQPSVVSKDLGRARKRLSGLAHDEGRPRHRLDPAGDGEIHLAGADGAGGVADCVQPRGAEPIDGDARNGVGQASQQQRHARNIAVVLAGLVGAAEEHLVEPRPVGLVVAGDQRPDRDRGQIVGPHLGERAAITADGRACRVANKDLSHRTLLKPHAPVRAIYGAL